MFDVQLKIYNLINLDFKMLKTRKGEEFGHIHGNL